MPDTNNNVEPQTAEEVKEVVSKKTDAEIVQEYIEGNRDMILGRALELQAITRENWFDLERILKKTQIKTAESALSLLNLLKLAGYLVSRINIDQKKEQYRIVLSLEDKRALILKDITNLQKHITIKQQELDVVDEEIAKRPDVTVKEVQPN